MNINNVEQFKLDNGLNILFHKNNILPMVNINLWVNVGSVNEPLQLNGISHFLEHMLFKDTQKYKNNAISKKIENIGGLMNAGTSIDFTHYYITLLKENIEIGFDVLADMAFNLNIDTKNLELEQCVIIEEIQRCNDNPWNVLLEELYRNFFQSHNYANPIIGNKQNILNISKSDLHNYYDYFYSPENLTLVIAGDLTDSEVLKLSNKYFNHNHKKIKNQNQIYPSNIKIHDCKILKNEYYEKIMPSVSQTYFAYAFNAPNFLQNNFYETILLNKMLGEGRSSLLYKRLKQQEKNLVWVIGSDFSEHKYGAVFSIYGICDYENLPKIDAILKQDIFSGIYTNKNLTNEDLDKAKRLFNLEQELELETCEGITEILGYNQIMSSWKNFEKTKNAVLKVKLDNVKKTAEKILNEGQFIQQIVRGN